VIKFLALIGTLYGIGVLGVGINLTVEAWDSQDISGLIEAGLLEGLAWPANLIDWLA